MTAPTRRGLVAALAALLLFPARSKSAVTAPPPRAIAAALRAILPPGLDPYRLGAQFHVDQPNCNPAHCLDRATLPDLAALPARVAADFAAGDTVTIDGWVLSRTEAWLCAALA